MSSWFSPVGQWQGQNNMQPWQYELMGFDPNNIGGQTYYNPYTNSTSRITPEMLQDQALQGIRYQQDQQNLYDALYAQHGWVAPGKYRDLSINGQNLLSMGTDGGWDIGLGGFGFGGAGGGGVGGYMKNGFTPWGGGGEYTSNINAPGAYAGDTIDPGDMVDVSALIDAEAKLSDTRRADAWADAAARFGQSGMAASTPYMNQLADVAAEEEARKDQIFGQLRYASGTDMANRKLQADMAQAQLAQQAWATQGGWDLAAQQANAGNNLSAWQTNQGNQFGGWALQNQLGMQDYWNQQDFNLQNNAMQMQQIMGLLGGIL